MRAVTKSWVQREAEKHAADYLNEHYDELKYQLFCENADDITKQAVAITLYALKQDFGFGTKRIQKAFDGIVAILQMPDVLGRAPNAKDLTEMLTNKYGVDFDRIHVRTESLASFMERR